MLVSLGFYLTHKQEKKYLIVADSRYYVFDHREVTTISQHFNKTTSFHEAYTACNGLEQLNREKLDYLKGVLPSQDFEFIQRLTHFRDSL